VDEEGPLTSLAPDERSCHAACGGKRRAKPLKQRTRSQVKLALGNTDAASVHFNGRR